MQRFKLSPIIAFSLGLGAVLPLAQYSPIATAQSPDGIKVIDTNHDYRPQTSQATALMEYVETNLVDRNRPSEGRRDGGASRTGPCALATEKPNLTALVPAKLQFVRSQGDLAEPVQGSSPSIYESVLSLTTETHPVLWFYVPYELNEMLTLNLVLQDETGNTLYQTEFVPDAEGPGIVPILLSQAFPLVEGERYNWYLNAYCGAEFLTYVEGWIERVAPSTALKSQLAGASGREQAALYAANGIWQDTLTSVAERYRNYPQDPEAKADWVNLLSSIEFAPDTLNAIIEAPLLDGGIPAVIEREL